MQKSYILALVVGVLGCLAAYSAPFDNCGFEKVPRGALAALQEARGKPFTAGAVFVNGKYIPPPYVVSRYGTAIAINGHQVTGQVIPWHRFTGRPASTTRSAAARGASGLSDGKNGAVGKYEVAKSVDDLFDDEPQEAEQNSDESADETLDDLFDDEPKKPQPKPKPKPAAVRRPAPVAPPPEPEEPDEPLEKFVHTARTRQLLETIDKQRTAIDRALRSNHFYFFSPRYSSVGGDLPILGSMAEKLPDALKDATSAEDLFARMRRAGLRFVSMEVCTDLYANKLMFPALYNLRNRVREVIEERKALTAEGSY